MNNETNTESNEQKSVKNQHRRFNTNRPKTKKVQETTKAEEVQKTEEQTQENLVVTEKKHQTKDGFKITFLGGVGEIGKNMTAVEYKDEIIIIDSGLAFPGDDLPGVDIVVPDVTYLSMNRDKVKAILLTHGHEDHIGGIPFLLQEVNVPIYGSRLTLALVENKLQEYPNIKYKCVAVKPRNVLKVGSFIVEFIKVNHSIAGSLALFITTPAGNLLHTGDFKIDFSPVDGAMIDLGRFGELGKKGVDVLLCESTNVCRKGYTMSESSVGKVLEELFKKYATNRLFIATFASNIHRLQQILDLAVKYKRRVVFTGRSMVNITDMAIKIGELNFDKSILVDLDKIKNYADNELLFVTTGSQGESMSALTRMANDDFKGVTIGENDTIILSASPIPGNEKSVYRVINTLFKKGANVIYDELADVHVSGHACSEEIKTIHSLVKPKFFIPVHGEYRHLMQHRELARSLGMEDRNIVLPDLGMQIEVSKSHIKKLGFVTAGQRLVDGLGMGDMDSNVLKERKQLSEDGICVGVMTISKTTGLVSGEPFVITRGVVYNDESEKFVADIKQHLVKSMTAEIISGQEQQDIRNSMKKCLQSFIFKRCKRRPIVVTIVMQGE